MQCGLAGNAGCENSAAPRTPQRQIPRQEFSLASDPKALIGALAVGLDTLLPDLEVERDADRRESVEHTRTNLDLPSGNFGHFDEAGFDVFQRGQCQGKIGTLKKNVSVL